MGRRYSLDPLADLVTGSAEQEDEDLRERPELRLTDQRLEALDLWSRDPWTFLTGTDPDTNEPIIRTIDQKDKRNPIKAFPSHLSYLHYYLEVMESEKYIQTEKASQMIVSTVTLLRSLWKGSFTTSYKALLSKHKEEEAALLLDEKIRQVWMLMPDWLRAALPLTLKPKNKITWGKTGASMLGLPENAAAADARGQTYHTGLIDEAEFQDALSDILTAMLPRAGQVIFWSTPAPGGEGARIFRSYLKDDPITLHPRLVEIRKKYVHLKGISLRRNESKNVTIVRIEHIADPAKRSPEWEREAAKPYPSMADFRREMKIDRSSNAGRPFYPGFAENPKRYVKAIPHLLDYPIIRGWDAGRRNPACCWIQYNRRQRRVWVIRELSPNDADMFVFRDLVKYLSGQLAYDSLLAHNTPSGSNRAYEILNELKQDADYPAQPWFTGKHSFVDCGGHEFVRPGPGLTKAGEPQVAAEILALGDIFIQPPYSFKKSRYEIIRGLSKIRNDGLPGMFIDPACPFLIRGFTQGGIVYAKGTDKNPDPNEPAVSEWSHIHDALGYALVNTVALEHADYFAPGPDGEIHLDLGGDEIEMMDSYLTGGEL
jgi:hypothetical protein